MKRTVISLILLILGLLLLLASVLFAFLDTMEKNIIGGADLPTFFFVYFRQSGGMYSAMGFFGFLSFALGILLKLFQRKSNQQS